jgi:DNA replication licensing factor MCM6
MLILYLREEEAKCVAQGSDTEGIKKSALVEWYLEQIQDMLETEEDLIERKLLVERLVDRLITHDQVLIPLRTGDLKHKGDQEMADEDDPLLMVHPNYVVDK